MYMKAIKLEKNDKMEYLDLYDENKELTGEKILRGKGKPSVPEGRFINIVIIFIQNSFGKFLFQKTSKEKGNELATTGGHVKSGQNCNEAIVSEVFEELGIDISNDNFELVDTMKFGIAFQDVYYLKKDIDIKNLTLQSEEVEEVMWLSVDEVKKFISQGKLRKGNIKAFENLLEKLN